MSISAISNHTPASAAAALEYASPGGLLDTAAGNASRTPTAADVKKAAAQFEAIIMRQLLAPSIEPIMSGGMGGASGTGGGGVYAHMLTEVLADSLSKAGGLGLGRMLEKEFTARTAGAAPTTAAPLSSNALLKPLTSSSKSL
jgi:Rod binding domain-containing protein